MLRSIALTCGYGLWVLTKRVKPLRNRVSSLDLKEELEVEQLRSFMERSQSRLFRNRIRVPSTTLCGSAVDSSSWRP